MVYIDPVSILMLLTGLSCSWDCDLEDVGSGWLWAHTSPCGDSVSSSSAPWWVVKVRAAPLSWVHRAGSGHCGERKGVWICGAMVSVFLIKKEPR